MLTKILILFLIILAFLFGFYFARKRQAWRLSQKARREKKEENKKKILEEIQNKGRITNDEVQELLGISDATATNYLEELEKEGKIKQIGKRGRQVFYQLKG